MPKKLIRRFSRHIRDRRLNRLEQLFGHRLTDPRLWSMNRHSITAGFGVGVAISFIPLPIHLLVVILVCVGRRLNFPSALFATYIVNPLTVFPIYYMAFRVGAFLLGEPATHFHHFKPNWHWLEHGLGPAWAPFLLGCLVCAVVLGISSRYLLELIWRWSTLRRYRTRHGRMLHKSRSDAAIP